MAKYNITYSCGHEGCTELFGKVTERERKIKWYETKGLCPECYKQYMRDIEKDMPLTLTVTTDSTYPDHPFTLIWSGPTHDHKDEIKALGGYCWSECLDDYGAMRSHMAWRKSVSVDELDAEIERVERKIEGVKVVDAINYGILASCINKQAEKAKKEAAIKERIAAIPKPVRPACMPAGHWNGTIYGSGSNGYSIYIDGNKITISKSDIEDIKRYMQAKKDYAVAVDEAIKAV